MEPKSMFFHYFFENVDLVKIVLPSRRNCYFSGSEPQKNDQKSMPKRARKKDRKNTSQKSILASILGSKTLPKSIKIPLKSDVKRSSFRDAMQTARKSSQLNGNQAFWTAKMAMHMIRSTPSIHPSIHWSAPRRPNHRKFFDFFSMLFSIFRKLFLRFVLSKFFSKNRSRQDDSFGPKIVKIGAILTVFRPFEISRKVWPVWAPSKFSMRIQNRNGHML